MAFTKSLWAKIGGFPEDVLVGEDTLFDRSARRETTPAFVDNAKALYHPRNTFRAATHQMARYAVSDGQARVRSGRLVRNASRCLLQIAAVAIAIFSLLPMPWRIVPLAFVLLLEAWYAYHRDLRALLQFGAAAVGARFVFAVAVPWVIAFNHIKGLFNSKPLTNWQNKNQ